MLLQTKLCVSLFLRWVYYSGAKSTSSSGEFIIFTILAIVALMVLYYAVTKLLERRALSSRKSVTLLEPLPVAHRAILSEQSDYYNQLNKTDKELFEKKVRHYMTSKMFTSEDGYAVTEQMRVLVSASASQLTLNLPIRSNSNYTHILIMPNAAMTPRSATRNSIVVPWREFIDGYTHSDDGQNEGLKVMATALIKDNRLQDKAYKIFAAKKFENWEKISLQEAGNFMSGMFQNMKTDERLGDEYFAMAVVYFFELPIAFKQKYPLLYTAMAALLGQDTVARNNRK